MLSGINQSHMEHYHHCTNAVAERRRALDRMLSEHNHNPNAVNALTSGLSAVEGHLC